jgi:hypothetical protein
MKKPHLVIARGDNGINLHGNCSFCPDAEFDIVVRARVGDEAILQAAFDVHFKTVHLREDASQAARPES